MGFILNFFIILIDFQIKSLLFLQFELKQIIL